jgi:hypothetical protein
MLKLGKYSLGVGDRFGRQACAQLRACVRAAERGVEVIPVWNKSQREHTIIGSEAAAPRTAADAAVKALAWSLPYHVDADHIRRETVDRFIPHSDFFTIDVADWIGKAPGPEAINDFVERHREFTQPIVLPGFDGPICASRAEVERIARKFLLAIQQAGQVYRHIVAVKGQGRFITEVSFDETDEPQSPAELLIILAGISDEGIALQTIAPKFTGRFNKGVDYAGDLGSFEQEFNADLGVLNYAIKEYNLPANLKLSIHSGSDKFSIYAPMRQALKRFDAGVHLKTAGTTWLEEVIGLAEAKGAGLALAKEIYAGALEHMEELCAPYASVIDIDRSRLPSASTVQRWTSEQFVAALRHEPANPEFNPHLRQLMHVGYKIAAQMGGRYLDLLEACEASVAKNVTENLYERHLKPLFL